MCRCLGASASSIGAGSIACRSDVSRRGPGWLESARRQPGTPSQIGSRSTSDTLITGRWLNFECGRRRIGNRPARGSDPSWAGRSGGRAWRLGRSARVLRGRTCGLRARLAIRRHGLQSGRPSDSALPRAPILAGRGRRGRTLSPGRPPLRRHRPAWRTPRRRSRPRLSILARENPEIPEIPA